MEEPSAPGANRSLHTWGPWTLFVFAVVVLLLGAWLRRHSLDDAFINYRIVHQLQAGNGPVFNAGERIEAFTSPLWLGLLAVGDVLLPIRLEWIGMLGGIVAGAIGLVFAGLGSKALHGDEDGSNKSLLLPVGALVLAVFPPIYRLIATGLEDGITIVWLGACLWVMARWSRSDKPFGLWPSVLIGLGVLVRPDLAPFTATFMVAVLIGDRRAGWKRNAATVACAAAIPVLSEILRMGYFGLLTPNTAIAKSAGLARWSTGWTYLTDTIVPYWFWIPLLVLVAVGYRPLLKRPVDDPRQSRRRLVAAAFLAGSVLCTIYIVRVGGDYMETRLLLGAIIGFVAPVTFVAWPRRHPRFRLVLTVVTVAWLVVIGLFVRTPSDDRAVLFESRNAVTLHDFQKTMPGPIAPRTRPGSVHYMYDLLPYASARGATPTVIDLGVGKVGYALDNDIYLLDALGLANPIAAHEKLRVRGWPGHEKLLTAPWIAALSTAPGSAVSESSFPIPKGIGKARLRRQDNPQGRPFIQRVTTARGVMECQTMRDFVASYSQEMSPSRFFDNLTSSLKNQRLVVPGEPADAARTLCSPQERARIDRDVNRVAASR